MNPRAFAVAVLIVAAPAAAWDAAGHRMVTAAALDGMSRRLGAEGPDFLRDRHTLEMIADGATTPDRWRSVRSAQLTHLNNPDHYLDLEELPMYGMTLKTMPPLRHEYVRQLTLAREKPGFTGPPINEKFDPNHVREYPGFLPHATLENYAKLVSAFRTIRSLEKLNDPARQAQLDMAKATALVTMGVLSHYVGDASQPLHTTIHHHGWVGDNPRGYTTDNKFHSYIDGGVVRLHGIVEQDVKDACKAAITADPRDPWDDFAAHIQRSFDKLEPLYEMKKSGELEKEPGKAFIIERLADGADTLGALYAAAWRAAAPDDRSINDFIKFDGDK